MLIFKYNFSSIHSLDRPQMNSKPQPVDNKTRDLAIARTGTINQINIYI